MIRYCTTKAWIHPPGEGYAISIAQKRKKVKGKKQRKLKNLTVLQLALCFFSYWPFTVITTYSELVPVLNCMFQSEIPEVTMKSVSPRRSYP